MFLRRSGQCPVGTLPDLVDNNVVMNESQIIREREAVADILSDPAFQPPPAGTSLGTGSTAELRNSMARFSSSSHHQQRRADVDALLRSVDLQACEAVAMAAASTWFNGTDVQGRAVGDRVPTRVLAAQLRVESPSLVADVAMIAGAIGAGATVDDKVDAATDRLLDSARRAGHDPVAAISALYQNYAATRSLLLTTWQAEAAGDGRQSAIVRTHRVGPAGPVELDLRSAGFEFGAGIHECPGREIATAIVAGICAAARAAGFRVDASSVESDDDGLPIDLSLARHA